MTAAIAAVLFDLDQTLVNSAPLKQARDKKDWKNVMRRIGEVAPYPDLLQVLHDVAGSCTVGIVTSAPRVYAEAVVNALNLPLPVVTAFHDTTFHKPHPAPILHGLKAIGANSYETVYVGDEVKDIEAARAAKVRAVAAAWGIDTRAALEAAKPWRMAETPNDLHRALFSEN